MFDKGNIWEEEKNQPNAAGIAFGKGNGKSIMFSSHADVAAVTEEQYSKWSINSP